MRSSDELVNNTDSGLFASCGEKTFLGNADEVPERLTLLAIERGDEVLKQIGCRHPSFTSQSCSPLSALEARDA